MILEISIFVCGIRLITAELKRRKVIATHCFTLDKRYLPDYHYVNTVYWLSTFRIRMKDLILVIEQKWDVTGFGSRT